MAFQKGQPKIAGRVAGTPNKLTASVKEAFSIAFEKIGGAEALAEWATRNKTEFYKLASKLIPTDVNMAVKEVPEARVYPLGIGEKSNVE
jgi:hypothetical protein